MPSRAARKRFSSSTSGGIGRSRWSSPSTSARTMRLDQGGERGGVGERRLGVHDPHLDGAEARLRAHVPPEEGRLGHGVAADQHVDRLDVLGVVGEGARDADPGEGLEERRPGRGEAGVAPLPEGRVDREREQQREVGAQPVGGVDRRFGVGHADVDVEAEGRLAAGQLAHRAVDELVALAGGDDDLLPDREGVGAGAGGPHRERPQGLVELAAQRRAAPRSPSPMRPWTPVWISSAEPWVSAVKLVGAAVGEARQDAVDPVGERPAELRRAASPPPRSRPCRGRARAARAQVAQAGSGRRRRRLAHATSRPLRPLELGAVVAAGIDEAAEQRRLVGAGGRASRRATGRRSGSGGSGPRPPRSCRRGRGR